MKDLDKAENPYEILMSAIRLWLPDNFLKSASSKEIN